MNIAWKEQLAQKKSGTLELSANGLQTVWRHLKNGSTAAYDNEQGQLVMVLAGECDIIQGCGRYRLTAGSWINIPGGSNYTIHVFRTCEDCCVVQIGAPGTATAMMTCSVFDMPAMDGVVYFGLETASLVGQCREKPGLVPADALSFLLTNGGKEYQCVISCEKDDHAYLTWLQEKYGILWKKGY